MSLKIKKKKMSDWYFPFFFFILDWSAEQEKKRKKLYIITKHGIKFYSTIVIIIRPIVAGAVVQQLLSFI